MKDFEKLGSFYLGSTFDLAAGSRRSDALVLYDSKDLVTHAVCVGMTGSGKTGLCIALLEEAAIDGIPALIIDPKGDLANLLLTFPNLAPTDFRPWINESDAQAKGLSPDDFARQQAELWKKGLESWGQGGDRIAKLRAGCDVRVYTPGSQAGIPLSILKGFECPPFEVVDDAELFRDRISVTASSLLSLAGIQGEAMRSREHVLLSTIFQNAWSAGQHLDLATIIAQVQQPPFQRVGVMEVEGFYPSKERFELAMALNNLLASPQFSAWSQGQPLDIGAMLFTPRGTPRLAIVSIAHLGESERMFFVALLMNQVLAWTRAQSGTTSLRAIVYMDEIAGYFPPVANPPSKQAMLTLMKQARAFGVGMVLATQNPVDLDYKGLANAGTWFIGRLQTEQDKARLLDGLQGAMNTANVAFDRGAMERTLSSLGKRVFLMHNVHDEGPTIFETRWAMSYLRGPLTRGQIKQLMDPVKAMDAGAAPAPAAPAAPAAPVPTPVRGLVPQGPTGSVAAPASVPASAGASPARPVLPPDVPQYFLPLRGARPAGAALEYRPLLLGFAQARMADAKAGVDVTERFARVAEFLDGPVPIKWDEGQDIPLTDDDVEKEPSPAGGSDTRYAPLHAGATKPKSYTDWSRLLGDAIARTHSLTLLRSEALKLASQPGESEKDFRLRLTQLAREQRDAAVDKLRQKYASKVQTLENRLRAAQQKVEVEEAQAKQSKVNTALSFGAAVLGGLLGKKVVSSGNVGRVATAARGASRAVQQAGDVQRAQDNLEAIRQQYEELQAQVQAEVDEIASRLDPTHEQFASLTLRPKKTDVRVSAVVLSWAPHWVDGTGTATPAWE